MSYFVAPLQKAKQNFPEFGQAMAALEQAVRARAESIWPGYTFGGLQPGPNQYGISNILPRHAGVSTKGFGSVSFIQKFTSPGSWTNIFSYTVPSNQIHGYAGLAFIGPTMIFNALRVQISDTILPIFEIEESRAWDPQSGNVGGVSVVVKADAGKELVANELVAITIKGFAERYTSGVNMRVVPIGMMAYKARDDLIILSAPSQ